MKNYVSRKTKDACGADRNSLLCDGELFADFIMQHEADDVARMLNEHAALVAVAEAAEKLEHRMKMWQRDTAEGVEVIHCRNGLEAALASLAAVRNSNK